METKETGFPNQARCLQYTRASSTQSVKNEAGIALGSIQEDLRSQARNIRHRCHTQEPPCFGEGIRRVGWPQQATYAGKDPPRQVCDLLDIF